MTTASKEVLDQRTDAPALMVNALDAGYGAKPIVRGLDLCVQPGEIVALLGANGSGKTTTMLSIAGLVPTMAGTVEINGVAIKRGDARIASGAGLVLVPDDRSLFTSLTVAENIQLASRRGGTTMDSVLDFFPALRGKLKLAAGQLSGGEQQMLAVARALVQDPKVLLIDELSMGLAPVIVNDLLRILRRVIDETRAAAIMVEQHVKLALNTADTAIVLAHGDTVLRGTAAELAQDTAAIERAYFGSRH